MGKRAIACLGALLMLAACGQAGSPASTTPLATGGGGGRAATPRPLDPRPVAIVSVAPTPVPALVGTALRVQDATRLVNGLDVRALILSNADPTRSASFPLGIGAGNQVSALKAVAAQTPDAHVARLRAESRLLAHVALPAPRYHLAQAAERALGSHESFQVLLDTDPGSGREAQITATLAGKGAHCYVWVDTTSASSTADQALMQQRVAEIVGAFERQIYATDTRLFGQEPNPGIDNEVPIHILISPAVNDYGANATLGYFSRRDEYNAQPNGPVVLQHSNQKELINIASSIVLTGSQEDYLGTIAHEFQHMINFNQKVLLGGHPAGEDLWLDEGMAMYAIDANGYGLKGGGQVLLGHVQAFQDNPGGYSLNDWDHNPQGIGYGPVYLFMVYLAQRFGPQILHEIVTSPGVGFANLEARLAAHGSRFTDLFSDWAAANLLDGVPGAPARLGYTDLDMHGTYGGVTLQGFRGLDLSQSGVAQVDLRPCTMAFASLSGVANGATLSVPAGVTLQSQGLAF